MNCLNRYEIQRFIDNEATGSEKNEFFEHIQVCVHCSELLHTAKTEADDIKRLLSTGIEFNLVTIPEFKVRTERRRLKKALFYYAAASILILTGVLSVLNKNKPVAAEINKSKADVLIDQYLYESDPNKIWTEKQSCITITDENGEVIYSNLNN